MGKQKLISMMHRIKSRIYIRLVPHPGLYAIAVALHDFIYGFYQLSKNKFMKSASSSNDFDGLYISRTHGLLKVKRIGEQQEVIAVPPFRSSVEAEENFENKTTDIKAIAYYLPQFHAIPENDLWWGKGFTEWTNTRKAKPLFPGHYQPREPHDDIGYYDLNDINNMKKQAEMARRHGIYGFCFYHYWFHGKRLLGKPVDMFLKHPEIDIAFCLCWANETWSKKWDGKDHHILMQQNFSPEDDIRFIEFLGPFFKDPRYIRLDSKPVLLVYCVSKLHSPRQTAERWRRWCRENGIGDIHLVAVCHGEVYPHMPLDEIGFDAYAAFPPHNFPCQHVPSDPIFDEGFRFDYATGVAMHSPPHDGTRLYEGCTLGWDNTARVGNRANIWLNFSIAIYYEWLRKNMDYTRRTFPPEERFLFINAWNEWAEGTYLEPDKRYGYACLNTTSKALFEMPLQWTRDAANREPPILSANRYDMDYENLKNLIAVGAEHSLPVINAHISAGTEILEFGSSSGYFTRYLKKEKNVDVDIVEVDAHCAQQALKYSRDACVCDIEDYAWKNEFAGRKYDHILFADVLEHLRDPWRVLGEAAGMLKDDGSILISVPNIAHAQILACLYNNDFSYSDVGILDRSHLRFFTELTLRQMIENAGLRISALTPVVSPFLSHGCGTRLNMTNIPGNLQKILKNKPHAHTKQFVACCRKNGDRGHRHGAPPFIHNLKGGKQ